MDKVDKPTETKKQLLHDSEELVDLIYALEEAIDRNDENTSKAIINDMDALGSRLVGMIPDLEGDDLAYARFMLGSLCSSLQMWPEAERAYSSALETWPDHVGLLNEYFICLMQLEKYSEAREVLQSSMETGGETPELMQHYASVLVKLGKPDEAKITLINCMARFPGDPYTQELINELDKHFK